MHIPDGFINATTSLGAGVVTLGGLGVAVRRSAATLEDRQVPLAGLVAAFVFAAQMLNFPVAAGTSGHLIGAVLAAVLVGPWAGALCLSVVLLVQALFADGGLTALGLNILNLAFIAGLGGYALFLGLRKLLPKTRPAVALSAGVASGFSVVLAATAFLVEYAFGANVGVPIGTVAGAMVGVHVLIGVGEGVITAMTVSAVLSIRPDLVHGARDVSTPAFRAPTKATAAVEG
jgi:cobalt/nickel transport system permease protein